LITTFSLAYVTSDYDLMVLDI